MNAPDSTAEIADLRRELAGLRRELAALREERAAKPRLRLVAARETALLGQRILITAEATDGRGAPLTGRSITFAATAGGLRRPGNQAPVAALAFEIDPDGFARAELTSLVDQALGTDDRAVLEVALAPFQASREPGTRFDPGAPTTAEALLELARRYQLHGNVALRNAIDACFRTADAPRTMEGDSGGQTASVWRAVPVAILGQVSDGIADEPSTAIAGAVLSVAFYDWRGPFLEALRSLALTESTLPRQLLAEGQGADADALPGRLYDRIRRFIADQRGEIGQAVARGHAQEALVGFFDRGTRELSVEQRRALFPALALGSSALAAGATTTLAAVGQARTDLKKVIDSRPRLELGPVLDRLTAAEADIRVKADRRTLDDALSDIQTRFGTEAAARGELLSRIDAKLDRAWLDAGLAPALTAVRTELTTMLNQETRARLDLDRKLDSQNSTLKTRLEEEKVAREELGRKIEQNRDRFDTLGVDLKSSLAAETRERAELAAKLDAEVAASATLVTALQAEVNARTSLASLVATKADAAQVADLRSRTEATSTQIATLRTSIGRIDRDIAEIRIRPRPT